MLYSFLTSLVETFSFLNVFKYITFRIGLSVITSLIIIFLIGTPLINYFSKKQITGPIRQDGPIDHIIKKSGTPTMGGLMILIGIIISTIMWADLTNPYIWIVLFVCTSLGLLGFIDDYLKIKFTKIYLIMKKNTKRNECENCKSINLRYEGIDPRYKICNECGRIAYDT